MFDHVQERRLWESGEKDTRPGGSNSGGPNKYFDDLNRGLGNGEIKPSDFSIRKLIENFVPDGGELVQSMDPRRGEPSGHQMAATAHLLEADAVKPSAFANISGQIFYNETLDGFTMESFTFSAMIPTTQTAFSGEKIAGITNIGDRAEIVDVAEPYPLVGVGEDWVQTPETVKRGLVVPVTREAIFFDRTSQLLEHARQVGEWLGVNKEKRAVDCVIDENTTAHRYNRKNDGVIATYGDNSGTHDFDNLQVSNDLVDWTDIDLAEILFNAITDPNTGEPVIVGAVQLIVTRARLKAAQRVLNTTEIREITNSNTTSIVSGNMLEATYSLVTSRWLAARMVTDTDWYLGDVAGAFRYMENFPLQVVQAPPNSELEFSNDIVMRFKASERGTYATKEPRKMVKNVVATAD